MDWDNLLFNEIVQVENQKGLEKTQEGLTKIDNFLRKNKYLGDLS